MLGDNTEKHIPCLNFIITRMFAFAINYDASKLLNDFLNRENQTKANPAAESVFASSDSIKAELFQIQLKVSEKNLENQ